MTTPTSRFRAALNISLLNDVQREATLAGIQKVAQQSSLFQIPAIAAAYTALTATGATFTSSVATAAANLKQYKASASAADVSRVALDRALDTLKTLTENNAVTAADVTGMGFSLLTVAKASKVVPDPPGALLVIPGKVHGKARVMVQGVGYLGHFVAQVSNDPIGAFTALPGNGKERRLSGYASGTKLWVQFAAVRWGLQSAWSVPVLVTIP
jgi:hypothetical protein